MARCEYIDVIFDVKGLLNKKKKCYNIEGNQKNGDDTLRRCYSCKISLLMKVIAVRELSFSCILRML